MNIKADAYRVFVAAAEAGSFSGAAEKLYLTQSAVSQSIRSLEEQLGTLLFARSKGGTQLTAEGKVLYGYSSRAMDLLAQGEKVLAARAALSSGELRVGAGDTLCRYFLLPLLKEYHNRYPELHISVTNRVTDDTLRELRDGNVEIAFVNLPCRMSEEDSRFVTREVAHLREIFVAAPGYSLPSHPLAPEELLALPLIMLENKSITRRNVDLWFSSRGLTLTPEIEPGSHDLLLEFAAAGLGIACVTREFSEEMLSAGKLVEVPTAFSLPERSLGMVTLRNLPLSHAADAFYKILAGRFAF